MPKKKRKTSKKQKKPTKRRSPTTKKRKSPVSEVIDPIQPEDPLSPNWCNQYEDNILLDNKENVDLLETIDGIDYNKDQFQQDFPHLSDELGDPNLQYPMDAVRWEDEEATGGAGGRCGAGVSEALPGGEGR